MTEKSPPANESSYVPSINPEYFPAIEQAQKLLEIFYKQDEKTRDVFCLLLLGNQENFAGRRLELEHDTANILSELGQKLNALYQKLEKRADPLIRKGKAPKSGRNDIIHSCLTVAGFAKDKIYSHMLSEHAELMHVGKGKESRTIGEASMWARYREWKLKLDKPA